MKMTMSQLFSPFTLRSLTLENRVVVSPMCQYICNGDGQMHDWHLMHLGQLAMGGAGLLFTEATHVSAVGRISPRCAGLWNDAQEAAMKRVLDFCKAHGVAKTAIQLAHAGRKASCEKPWDGGGAIAPDHENGWQVVAPSAVPFRAGDPEPEALNTSRIREIIQGFADAAKRADRLGLDAIEIHGAHGYLLHQFLSPHSNKRDDDYGGSLENRMRIVIEVYDAVRAAFDPAKPVGIRISASDWVEGGWDIDQSAELARVLKERGCDFIHVSSGGLHIDQNIPVGPNYQVPFADRIKSETGMITIAVGLITEAEQAEAIVFTGQADAIALARGILYDPRWPWHAAASLGAEVKAANQYLRCQPRTLKKLFG